MKILFCESESLYHSLVDYTPENVSVEYWGVKYANRESAFFKKFDAILTSNFTSPSITLVILKAKLAGVKTAFLADGIYDVSNSFRNPNLEKYSSFLYDLSIYDFMFVVGDVYVSKVLCKLNVVRYMPKRVIDKEMMNLKRNRVGKVVLITTANTPYFNETEFERLVVILKKIILKVKKCNGVKLKFRLFDEKLLVALGVADTENFIEGDIYHALSDVTHAITTPSSISIPIIKYGLPLLHIQIRPEPPLVFSGWLISCVNMIDECFEEYIYEYENKVNLQNTFLENRYENTMESPVSYILETTIDKDSRVDELLSLKINNMYSSYMNFNFEYFLRRIADKVKKARVYRFLRSIIK